MKVWAEAIRCPVCLLEAADVEQMKEIMRFCLLLSDGGSDWKEEYNVDTEDPNEWAIKTIDFFNRTLKPYEKKRILRGIEIIENSNDKLHRWEKDIKGMSVVFRGKHCDIMYCSKCGITGKRYGLEHKIIPDSKYRKKVFVNCDTAIKYFREKDAT